MVSSTRRAIACILVIFGSALFSHSQIPPAKEPPASISGKVTIKGKGAAGITVALRKTSQMPSLRMVTYKGVTDEEGNYRITNVPPGTYQVMTVAPAFVAADDMFERKTLIVNKGETIENLDFTLVRGGVITGKVTDADGRPVIEEAISLMPSGNDRHMFLYMLHNVQTDDRGIYRAYGVPEGTYRVGVGRDSERSMGTMGSPYSRTYYPGTPDLAQATPVEVTAGNETTNIDITVGRTLTTYTASGRVIDGETGRPLPNVYFGFTQFVNAESTSSVSTGAVTNSRGEFKLENLLPGKYAVFIRPQSTNEWRADSLRFEIIDQDVTGLVIKTVKGASISGVVVVEGGADDKTIQARFKRISIHSWTMGERPSRYSEPAVINPDGSFHLAGLAPGLTQFSVLAMEGVQMLRIERDGLIQPRGIDVKEGEQITGVRVVLGYGNATILGTVKFENGTAPSVSHLFVSVKRPSEDPTGIVSSSDASPQVDARGQFIAEGLLPGTYEISVVLYVPNARSLPRTKQQVVVTSGSVINLTFTLNLDSLTGKP